MDNACLKQRNPPLHLHKNLKFLVIHSCCDPGVTLVQKLRKEALKPNCPGTQLTGMTMSEEGKGQLFPAQSDIMTSVNYFPSDLLSDLFALGFLWMPWCVTGNKTYLLCLGVEWYRKHWLI